MNAIFDYTKDDHDKFISDIFKNVKSYEDVGLTEEQYKKCDEISYKYVEEWNNQISDDRVIPYGFIDMNDFKNYYIRSKIYNDIIYSKKYPAENEDEFILHWFSWKVGHPISKSGTNITFFPR